MGRIEERKGKVNCIIISHDDLDGVVSAYCMSNFLKDRGESVRVEFYSYQGMERNLERVIQEKKYDEVYLLDLSLSPKSCIFGIVEKFRDSMDFFWFDHHASSDISRKDIFHFAIVETKNSCAAELVLEYTGGEKPLEKYLAKLAHDRDFWNLDDKDSIWINDVLEEIGPNELFMKFSEGNSSETNWVKENEYFVNAYTMGVEKKKKSIALAERTLVTATTHKSKIASHNSDLWGIVFCRGYASDVAHVIMEKYSLDAVALVDLTKFDNPLGVSFRTNRDDIDVSEIAERLGGGGHKKAAGAHVPLKELSRLLLEKILE